MSTTENAGSQETVGEITFAAGLTQLAQYTETADGATVIVNPAEQNEEKIPERTIPAKEIDIGDGQMETTPEVIIPPLDSDIDPENPGIMIITREMTGAASGFPKVEEEAYGNFSNASVQNLFEDLLTAKAQETIAATFHGTVARDEVKAAEESAKAFAHYATAAIVGFINNLTIEAQHTFTYADITAFDTSPNGIGAASAASAMGIILTGVKTGKVLNQIDTVYTIKVKG